MPVLAFRSPARLAACSWLSAGLLLSSLACVPSSRSDASPKRDSKSQPVARPAAKAKAPAKSKAAIKPKAPPAPPPYVPRKEDLVTPHQAIENPEALDYVFAAFKAVDEGEQRLIRVVHMGASSIGADDLPSILRERFQNRFGDGGAGLVLMARYMRNYLHRWVKLDASGWEHCYIAYKCLGDRHYGLGGTAFWSRGGAKTTISTRDRELGDEVSRFELWYLARPGGGRVELRVDREEPVVVDTRAEKLEDRFYEIDVEQGPHEIRVRALGRGNSRLYGVLLETDGPGLVWDQFSKLGVFTNRVLEWDAEHLAGQIAHRDPDLIVLTYGGNDLRRVANGKLTQAEYVDEFIAVVKHMRRGKPEASCLITTITDRGKSLNFDITPEHIQTLVDAQREVAKRTGCAFFDTYTAMGGGGSLKKWRALDPPLAAGDLKHLNHAGRLRIGGWMYDALISAYVDYRRRAPTPGAR